MVKFLKNEELNRPEKEAYAAMKKLPYTVVLDNVRSGLNIGSIFRSADSFMAAEIILCGISACPPERDILKTALGATETVKWSYCSTTIDAVKKLKSAGFSVYAVEQGTGSVSPDAFKIPEGSFALIFGNEVKGVDPELLPLLEGCIEIPQSGTKHSLNIAVSAGIVLWEMYRKLSR